jgi:hypothetical protein
MLTLTNSYTISENHLELKRGHNTLCTSRWDGTGRSATLHEKLLYEEPESSEHDGMMV